MEKILVRYHSDEIKHLEKFEKGDWIDLRSAEHVVLKAGEHAYIDLGLSMKLPDGYEAHLAPRSSTFKKWGILQTNTPGIVDNSYCGDNDIWKMSVVALRDTEININDRICQFRIVKKQPKIKLETVEFLIDEDRGGFGSTGKN